MPGKKFDSFVLAGGYFDAMRTYYLVAEDRDGVQKAVLVPSHKIGKGPLVTEEFVRIQDEEMYNIIFKQPDEELLASIKTTVEFVNARGGKIEDLQVSVE